MHGDVQGDKVKVKIQGQTYVAYILDLFDIW